MFHLCTATVEMQKIPFKHKKKIKNYCECSHKKEQVAWEDRIPHDGDIQNPNEHGPEHLAVADLALRSGIGLISG